jgi:hypothetical protein
MSVSYQLKYWYLFAFVSKRLGLPVRNNHIMNHNGSQGSKSYPLTNNHCHKTTAVPHPQFGRDDHKPLLKLSGSHPWLPSGAIHTLLTPLQKHELGPRWLSLLKYVNTQCTNLLSSELVGLAQAHRSVVLSLRFQASDWKILMYMADLGEPAELAKVLGVDISQFWSEDPVQTLTPILSLAAEVGLSIDILDSGSRFCSVGSLEPLMEVALSALASIRKLSMPLTVTAADLDDGFDKPIAVSCRWRLPLKNSK